MAVIVTVAVSEASPPSAVTVPVKETVLSFQYERSLGAVTTSTGGFPLAIIWNPNFPFVSAISYPA